MGSKKTRQKHAAQGVAADVKGAERRSEGNRALLKFMKENAATKDKPKSPLLGR